MWKWLINNVEFVVGDIKMPLPSKTFKKRLSQREKINRLELNALQKEREYWEKAGRQKPKPGKIEKTLRHSSPSRPKRPKKKATTTKKKTTTKRKARTAAVAQRGLKGAARGASALGKGLKGASGARAGARAGSRGTTKRGTQSTPARRKRRTRSY